MKNVDSDSQPELSIIRRFEPLQSGQLSDRLQSVFLPWLVDVDLEYSDNEKNNTSLQEGEATETYRNSLGTLVLEK